MEMGKNILQQTKESIDNNPRRFDVFVIVLNLISLVSLIGMGIYVMYNNDKENIPFGIASMITSPVISILIFKRWKGIE